MLDGREGGSGSAGGGNFGGGRSDDGWGASGGYDNGGLGSSKNEKPRRSGDRKSTRLNSSHLCATRMPYSARNKQQLTLYKHINSTYVITQEHYTQLPPYT